MKSILKILLISFVLSMCAIVSNSNANEKTYINGIDADYRPFTYLNEEGKPDGLDIAAMNWVAKEMGFKVTHQEVPWYNVIPTLLAKKIDLIASGMSITPKRAAKATFSNPYWQMPKIYLVRSDSTLDVNAIQNTKIRLGVQRGTNEAKTALDNIHNKGYRYSLRLYKTTPLAIEELISGRIEAAALAYAQSNEAISQGKPVKILGEYGDKDDLGIAMRHEDKELHKLINEGYKRLMADPYWEEIKRIYLKKQ